MGVSFCRSAAAGGCSSARPRAGKRAPPGSAAGVSSCCEGGSWMRRHRGGGAWEESGGQWVAGADPGMACNTRRACYRAHRAACWSRGAAGPRRACSCVGHTATRGCQAAGDERTGAGVAGLEEQDGQTGGRAGRGQGRTSRTSRTSIRWRVPAGGASQRRRLTGKRNALRAR